MRDYYKTLGIDRKISQKDLKKHYYKLAKKYHPDTASNGDKDRMERQFKEITEAYNALSTVKKRQRYDMGPFQGTIVSSNGFSNSTSGSRRASILKKLRIKKDFSHILFASELGVSNSNLIKILVKFISIMDLKARIEEEFVIFNI